MESRTAPGGWNPRRENCRWVAPRGGGRGVNKGAGMHAHTAAIGIYLMDWGRRLAQDPVGKVGVGALVAAASRIETAFQTALVFVLAAWAADFVVGVARAVVDKDVELEGRKVAHGLARLLVIPMVAVTAALIEGFTYEVLVWDPDGKIILGACLAMFWEECMSIQRNGRHFYRALRFRLTKLPWFNPDDGDNR